MFSKSFWTELGRLLTAVARAGAEGSLVFSPEKDEFVEEVFWECRLTRHLLFVCVDPPLQKLIAGHLNAALSEAEAEMFSEHLYLCDRCREELKSTRLAAKLVEELRRLRAT